MTTSARRAAALLATSALLAILAAPASAAPAMRRCGKINFTPNTEDVAVAIRITSDQRCRRARKVVRDVHRHARRGRYNATEGFSCRGRQVEPHGLPYVRWRCVNGLAVLTWKQF